jgi:hypothetical protein
VRVYQRKDQLNTGCDPKDFPTAAYIASHIDAYEGESLFFGWLVSRLVAVPMSLFRPLTLLFPDRNATAWPYAKPKNQRYDGSC